jgi:hypothetical protein
LFLHQATTEAKRQYPAVALIATVFIALNVLRPHRRRSSLRSTLAKFFKDELKPNGWLPKLKEIAPSYGEPLIDDADLTRRIRPETARVLNLEYV